MTRRIKTKEVEKGLHVNFLQKAAENAAAAGRSQKEGEYNAAAVSAVYSAISAADAYCVFSMGKRCVSENHKDTGYLILETFFPKEISAKIAKLFDGIIRIKHMAEYEERLVRPKEAEKVVKDASELIEAVSAAIRT